jgi:hypothetical protein
MLFATNRTPTQLAKSQIGRKSVFLYKIQVFDKICIFVKKWVR